MISKSQTAEIQRWSESVDAEVYEELLNRYERILVFAGQLQEKLNQQRLLTEKNEDLDKENRRLQRLVAVEESYVRLLENALEALGVMNPDEVDLSGPKP
jgi:hypothetical protein